MRYGWPFCNVAHQANQLAACLPDECPHLRVLGLVAYSFHEDEARPTALGGAREFTLRGQDAFGILESVLVAEEAEVQIATVHILEVERIGGPVRSRNLLEQENFDEAPHQRL